MGIFLREDAAIPCLTFAHSHCTAPISPRLPNSVFSQPLVVLEELGSIGASLSAKITM